MPHMAPLPRNTGFQHDCQLKLSLVSIGQTFESQVDTEQSSAAIELRIFSSQSASILEETTRIIFSEFKPVLESQPGFISARIYPSHDCKQLVLLTAWRSLKHQNIWVRSGEYKTASAELLEMIESGQVRMEVRNYLTFSTP